MSHQLTTGTAQEATGGRVSAFEPGIEAQDVQALERAADGRTADPDQHTALRAWLVDAAARSRHNALHVRIPEAREALHGAACGYESTVMVIDRLMAGERMPTIQGVHPRQCTTCHPAAPTAEAGR